MDNTKELDGSIDWFKKIKKEMEKQEKVCPHCGRCPVCGRRYHEPYIPWYHQPYVMWSSSDGTK